MHRKTVFVFIVLLLTITSLSESCSGSKTRLAQAQEIVALNPPSRKTFPTSNWLSKNPEELGLRSDILEQLTKYCFDSSQDYQTQALLIIKDGYLAYEHYHPNYTTTTRHKLWSVSKSVVNLLYGIAVQQGKLSIDSSVADYLPEFQKRRDKKNISIRHLLNMSSGLSWQEDYEDSPLKSSVIAMLYTEGRKDMADYVSQAPLIHAPGTVAQYSSGETMLLMEILRQALGTKLYQEFPWQEVFEPLGIQATFETDRSGNFIGSSYLYLSARDLAKIGFLFLNNGNWQNNTMLSDEWLKFTRTPSPALYKQSSQYIDPVIKETGVHSAHWWVNTNKPWVTDKNERTFPDLPTDVFYASGHWGQYLFVIPAWDMILVRFGNDTNEALDINQIFKILKQGVIVY